jgi:hypothetical protein
LSFLATAIASGSTNSTLSDVEPGALGFLVVAGMGLILVFLLKNMNKQFKKLGPPPEETDAESVAQEAGTDQPATPGLPAGLPPGLPAGADRAPKAIEAGTPLVAGQVVEASGAGEPQDTVQTGDAKQDQRAQGITKRK